MLYFKNDYSFGAHPKVLEALINTNDSPLAAYGFDSYTLSAAEKIKKAIGEPDAQVYLIAGGTQTNQLVIDTVLAPYEGVISATSGHINVHEAGAIEFSGHKVLSIPSHEGKIDASELKAYIRDFYADGNYTHMVFPGMVYISHSTEYGTIYKKAELEAIHGVCREYNIPLFIDGARLGYALMCEESDMTIADLASLCDVFYIGGTKMGTLCGEAVVFPKGNSPKNFLTRVKQHGAMLAKSRLLGVQFDALFTDGLYFEIGKHTAEMTVLLKEVLKKHGARFCPESPTNQQFVILENGQMSEIEKEVELGFIEKYDENHTVARFTASWATKKEDVEALDRVLPAFI